VSTTDTPVPFVTVDTGFLGATVTLLDIAVDFFTVVGFISIAEEVRFRLEIERLLVEVVAFLVVTGSDFLPDVAIEETEGAGAIFEVLNDGFFNPVDVDLAGRLVVVALVEAIVFFTVVTGAGFFTT